MILAAYFAEIFQLMQALGGVRIERYEKQFLSATRGNLRLRLRFADQALLEISEAVLDTAGTLLWLSYRYHYQEPLGLVLRDDNAPHHPRGRNPPGSQTHRGRRLGQFSPYDCTGVA